MTLLIYDNGNLVKNLSDAQFPQRGVTPAQGSPIARDVTQQNMTTSGHAASIPSSSAYQPSVTQTRSTTTSSRLYEETGRKSDSLQDRRRLMALHVMSSPPITVGQFETVKKAWETLQSEEIDHLIVVNSRGFPLGIVTGGDLLRYGSHSESFIENLLHPPLVAVSPETLVREIALIFMEQKVSSVPVVNKAHQVVGIVCRSDLLRLLVSGPNLEQRV